MRETANIKTINTVTTTIASIIWLVSFPFLMLGAFGGRINQIAVIGVSILFALFTVVQSYRYTSEDNSKDSLDWLSGWLFYFVAFALGSTILTIVLALFVAV